MYDKSITCLIMKCCHIFSKNLHKATIHNIPTCSITQISPVQIAWSHFIPLYHCTIRPMWIGLKCEDLNHSELKRWFYIPQKTPNQTQTQLETPSFFASIPQNETGTNSYTSAVLIKRKYMLAESHRNYNQRDQCPSSSVYDFWKLTSTRVVPASRVTTSNPDLLSSSETGLILK